MAMGSIEPTGAQAPGGRLHAYTREAKSKKSLDWHEYLEVIQLLKADLFKK